MKQVNNLCPDVFAAHWKVPSFATEFSPASGYRLEHKRHYWLAVETSTHKVDVVQMSIRFPYPVEAAKISNVGGMREETFQPSRPLINLFVAKLEDNGCLGRWSNELHRENVQGVAT